MGLHIYRPDLSQVVKLAATDTFEVVGCAVPAGQCGEDNFGNLHAFN
jgi:hypothetical protein